MTATKRHLTALHAQLTAAGIKDRDAKLGFLSQALGRKVASSKDLTTQEVNRVSADLVARASEASQ